MIDPTIASEAGADQALSPKRLSSRRLFSLQWQITIAVALGLLTLFGAFGVVAYATINQSTGAALHERQAIAAQSAAAIDALIGHVRGQMVALAATEVLGGGPGEPLAITLEQLRFAMGTVETLSLVDLNTGEEWWSTATGLAPERRWVDDSDVAEAAETGRVRVFQIAPTHVGSSHPALAVIAVPLARPDGARGSKVLVGDIHLEEGGGGIVPLPRFSDTSGTAIIDDDGEVLAATSEHSERVTPEHFRLISRFEEERKGGVKIHRPSDDKSHVVAFAPFREITGGVIVEEREDVVLAIPRRLRRNLLLFGSAGLALASTLAWLHARRTMRPVKKLTRASQLIAAGVLDERIEVQRNDEIGVLAQSFETMRQQLLDGNRQRLRWEQEMETRVSERTQQVQTLLGRVISAQEEERKRVARDLHDVIAQDLATVLITLQRISQDDGALDDEQADTLERAERYLADTLKELRRTISDLRPSELDDIGLTAAIRGHVEKRASETGLHLDFTSTGEIVGMSGPAQTALFRIVQEAINNVVRHAGAEHLRVSLQFGPEGAVAVVEDDGCGFDADAADGGSGLRVGILGMKERAALFDGSVIVKSTRGRGTMVKAQIPVSA